MAKVSSFLSFIYCQKMGSCATLPHPSKLRVVYHPSSDGVSCVVFQFIISIDCTLLLALGFVWGLKCTEALGERASIPLSGPGPCTVEQ